MRRNRVLMGVGLLASALAVVLVWFRPEARARRELDRIVAELRARGVPTSLEEIERPHVAPEDEGWPGVVEANERWDALVESLPATWRYETAGPWNMSLPAPWWESASDEQMTALHALLETAEPILADLDRALAKPSLRWPLPPLDGYGGRGGERVSLIDATQKVLLARAIGGRTAEERLEGMLGLARLGSGIHSSCGGMFAGVPDAVLRSAVDAVEVELSRGGDATTLRETLDRLFDHRGFERIPGVLEVMRAELIDQLPYHLSGATLSERTWGEALSEGWQRALAGQNPFGRALQVEPELAVGLVLDFDKALALEPSPDRSYQQGVAAAFDAPPSFPRIDKVVAFALESHRQMVARTALARVALAACVHRDAHAEWPRAPEELGPLFEDGAVPRDPYTGGPFLFTLEGEELVIAAQPWSILDPARYATRADCERAGLIWRLRAR